MSALLLAIAILVGAVPLQTSEDVSDTNCEGATILVATDQSSATERSDPSSTGATLRTDIASTRSSPREEHTPLMTNFCGSPVLRTRAPEGWATTLDSDRGGVRWSRGGADFHQPGIASGSELSGFEVILKPGWRRSRRSDVLWDESAASTFTTHDCD